MRGEITNALMAEAEEICTAASDASKGDRAERANRAAKELPLTTEETDCIGAEPIRMDVAVLPVINYAMQQNGGVAIQSITIENNTDSVIENVDIRIISTPEFALPFTRHIDHLSVNKSITISRPKLILNREYLAGMTQKVTGVMHIEQNSANIYLTHTMCGFGLRFVGLKGIISPYVRRFGACSIVG